MRAKYSCYKFSIFNTVNCRSGSDSLKAAEARGLMSLHKLSNLELETQLISLVQQERKLLHRVLLHIREVDNRKLYLAKARSSLYDYLVKDLGYSSSSAQRRIEASRLLKDIPTLAVKIQTGSLNLTQVGAFSQAIKQKEKESAVKISTQDKIELLHKIETLNTSQTQATLAKELDIELKPIERKQVQKDESVHLQITLSKVQYDKLMQCKNLAVHTLLQNHKSMNLSEVIEVLEDHYLKLKLGTGAAKKAVPNAVIDIEKPVSNDIGSSVATATATHSVVRKCITPKIRRELLQKYKCCQYRSSDVITGMQTICGSEFALEVDHLQPQWADGTHQDDNLTVLCGGHNKFKYQQQAHIQKYVITSY